MLVAVVLLLAGRSWGVPGVIAAAGLVMLALLQGRIAVAKALAPLELTPSLPATASDPHAPMLPATIVESDDEGFTGGIAGVVRPSLHLVPLRWREVLDPEAFAVAVRRRQMAVQTGEWWRGRLLALAFTLAGVALAASVVGERRLATAEGIVAFSLAFTLWSFVGLLTLPTPSRRGVADIDRSLIAAGCRRDVLVRAIELLDQFQDRERSRGPWIETIFHPVPSVESRIHGPRATGATGCWDAARSAVYLSAAGLGLLGRAVHCNCGRPALWAFLPID
jgi:hypothetical protein